MSSLLDFLATVAIAIGRRILLLVVLCVPLVLVGTLLVRRLPKSILHMKTPWLVDTFIHPRSPLPALGTWIVAILAMVIGWQLGVNSDSPGAGNAALMLFIGAPVLAIITSALWFRSPYREMVDKTAPLDGRSIPPDSRHQLDLSISAEDTRPVPLMVNLIISEALHVGSQQVHLHTGERSVSFLHADEWTEYMKVPAAMFAPVINRLRVLANLDRIEHNNRQEGTIEVKSDGVSIVIGMVVQFTAAGDEEVHLHLPDPDQA